MLSVTEAQLNNLGDAERTRLLDTHYPLGYHPTTHDGLYLPLIDRYSGMYVLGGPGMGKSMFLVTQIVHDICLGHAVIVIDPHGDLITQCIAHLAPERTAYTYLLDMEDVDYPFALNPFDMSGDMNDPIAHTQAIDRVMHIFEVLWPDILSQAYLPRFLRAACIVLMANKGTTLPDMHRFLTDPLYRKRLLQKVTDATVLQFWNSFDELTTAQQRQQVEPLIGRLESLFMGRSIVRNIIGQKESSINFRRAIEDREIIFIRLPLKTLPQDARLIGAIILAQIHAATFSFGDLSAEERPGFSLYLDEFQEFSTSKDIEELFTQGRKFGIRLTVAHQFRAQVPQLLQHATMVAGTKVCFRSTPDDAREMAQLFIQGEASMKPEDIDPHPVEHLLKHGSEDSTVQSFIDVYLRPLHAQVRSGQVEIKRLLWHEELVRKTFNPESAPVKPKTDDPTPYLNHLLYEVMKTGNAHQFVDPKIVYGFANMGLGFYSTFLYALNKRDLLTGNFHYPSPMIVEGANGLYCARQPDSSKEQMYHFLFHLHATMAYLAANPIGKKSTLTTTEGAHMLTSLPKRAAFVRSGEDVGVMYTTDTTPWMSGVYLEEVINVIREQTRRDYCSPKPDVRDIDVPNKPDDPGQPLSRWEEVE